ncbi:MAG: hypothetical protein ACEPOV_04900 [Hyphomicrobiales bacterium]
MEDIKYLLSGVEYKLMKLIELHGKTIAENESLRTMNQKLQAELKEKETQIVELKDKVNKIKFARVLGSEGEAEDVKKRIDRLVEDIDHCIGVMEN